MINFNNPTPKIRQALNALAAAGCGSQTDLVALAVHALEEAGVILDAEPGDPVLTAIARSSTYRFEVNDKGDLVVC